MLRKTLIFGALLTLYAQGVVADEGYGSGGFALREPGSASRASTGVARVLMTGTVAHGGTNAPAAVCPSAGEPTDADWVSWFELWSVTGVGGYVMANNPASYVPLLAPQPVLANGASESFLVGAAPVKKVAMCLYPTKGAIGPSDVEVILTRTGLTEAACGNVADPPCTATELIADPLNNLTVLELINDPQAEYVFEVRGPAEGEIGIHLGGRLGTYPQISSISN
jgi:hypothetical protein